jgi:alpha-glucosidase (family GH31 glycosyl hydrolase)
MRNKFLIFLFFLFLPSFSFSIVNKNLPPVSPSWVFDHWVWEDDENTEEALWKLIEGYEKHNIPVGVVIIDSPWSTEYNNFVFDTKKYPNPKEMIEKLHKKGIKVILWVTCMLNEENPPGEKEPKTNEIYREAKEKGYLINNGESFKWWKGKGAYLDYTNPSAVEWWHRLKDRVLDLGIDGWKVDEVSMTFPSIAQGKGGKISRKKYKDTYYIDFYEYLISKNPKGATLVRSVDFFQFSPIFCSPATWVGDQKHNFGKDGFLEAISNIFSAMNLGYAVIGSDTGGYHGDEEITKELLIRWAQFSAFCTLFENGGHGKHQPWLHDEETVEIYRYYVKLHLELKPYFYSLMMNSHLGGGNVFTADLEKYQFKIGDFILVSVIYENKNSRRVFLPEGNWLDFWTNKLLKGPLEFEYEVPLSKYPVFLKEGSIIPLEVVDGITGNGGEWSKDADTFLIVPGKNSSFTLYGENRKKSLIKMECKRREVSISVEDTEREKIFIFRNIDSVKGVTGNKLNYKKLKDLEEFSKTDFSFFYDRFKKILFVKSKEKGFLYLKILL